MLYNAAVVIESFLGRWHKLIQHWALWIVLLILLLAGAGVYYVIENLSINTDTADMLSEKLPWRVAYSRYQQAFPQYSDTMVIVIDADTPDRAQDASLLLAWYLKKQTTLFKDVYQIENSPFFRKNQLLYLSTEELQDLADNLAKVQPFLGKLIRDQSLRGFFTVLSEAITELSKGEEYELGSAFEKIDETLEAHAQGQRHHLSWQEMMSGRESGKNDRRALLIVKPYLDFSRLFPAEPAVTAIRGLARRLGLTPANGIRVRLTGDVALQYDEMRTVTDNALVGSLLSLVLVMAILITGFGSVWLALATLLKLIIGLIFTAAFATLTVGELNFISVGFAMLYIGLGVEYAIHYCLYYKDLSRSVPLKEALRGTGRHIGAALVFTAFTSAIGFYAFIPTPYSGIGELGLIVGTGMFISAALSLTFLPALLSLVPFRPSPRRRTSHVLMGLFSFSSHHPKAVVIATCLLALAALLVIPRASFDNNPVHLQDPSVESVRTYNDLIAESERSPLSAVILAQNAEAAAEISKRLEQLQTVDEVITLEDFVPDNQEEKLAIIEEISLVLGPELTQKTTTVKPSLRQQKLAITKLLTALEHYLASHPADPLANSAEPMYHNLKAIQSRLDAANEQTQKQIIDRLERDLLGSLPGRLRTLQAALAAEPFTYEDLPPDLTERWRSADGQYRIEVFPRENLNDNQALRRFVTEVRTIAPEATGEPVILTEASTTVIHAFQQALISALIAITLLLAILVKHKIDALLGLAPLLIAGVLTAATTVVLGMPFNFANIITLPLIFGICADNSIHILYRYRAGLPSTEPLFNTSAVRGVILCALTNIAGLGNLAASSHQGTASMGVMLTLGILFSLLTSLVVLPSLLKLTSIKDPSVAVAAQSVP